MNFIVLGVISFLAVARIEFSTELNYWNIYTDFLIAIFIVICVYCIFLLISKKCLNVLRFSSKNKTYNQLVTFLGSYQAIFRITLSYLGSKQVLLSLLLMVMTYLTVSNYAFYQANKIVTANQFVQKLPGKVIVEGEIITIPTVSLLNSSTQKIVANNIRTKFNFKVLRLFAMDGSEIIHPYDLVFRVSYMNFAQQLRQGQQWSLPLKIKPANGYSNPQVFNYEKWLHYKKINATAYVLTNSKQSSVELLSSQTTKRSQLRQKILAATNNMLHQSVMLGLLIGDRTLLSSSDWQLFRRTATSHLLAISGMHIGFFATIGFILTLLLVKTVARYFSQVLLWQPAQIYAAIGACIFAFIYTSLSGFALPAMRAFIMIFVVMCWLVMRLESKKLSILSLALFVVCVMQPFSVLSIGFYLSFVTVFIILLLYPHILKLPWYYRFLVLQIVLSIILVPLMSFIFTEFYPWGWLANLLAIPFVGFIIVPLLFFALLTLLILPMFAPYFFELVNWLIGAMYLWLTLIEKPPIDWYITPVQFITSWILLCIAGMIGVVYWKFRETIVTNKSYIKYSIFGYNWRGTTLIYFCIGTLIMLLVVVIFNFSQPLSRKNIQSLNDFSLKIFDVGNGNAILIQTKNKVLLYDTGAAYASGFNFMESVVLPYLQQQGIKKIDRLIISHSDNDHAGGYQSLLDSTVDIGDILAGQPAYLADVSNSQKIKQCMEHQSWQWGEVNFAILSPTKSQLYQHQQFLQDKKLGSTSRASRTKKMSNNDHSCVLRISNGNHAAILMGDTTVKAEKHLLTVPATKITADVLIVGHHGSSTSSSVPFIKHVSPSIAIYTTNYRSRYKFPKQDVRANFNLFKVKQLSSACSGFIEIVAAHNGIKIVQENRKQDFYFVRQCSTEKKL